MASLKEKVRRRLLDDMLGRLPNDETWKVMVVDDSSLKIISAACRVSDVMQKNVTIVESLTKKRQPFPKMDVVYFMAPVSDSVEKLLADWKSKSKMYNQAHIFFTNRVSRDVLDKIKASTRLTSKIKTLIELNLDFLAIERNCFSLNQPHDIQYVYGSQGNLSERKNVAKLISDQLVTFCLTSGQIPYVRYHKSRNDITQLVAEQLHDRLQLYQKKMRNQSDAPTSDSILMIVDRGTDALAPILHEFTYQAMAYDLLDIGEDNIYRSQTVNADGEEVVKNVMLDEKDEIWTQYRHKHIAEAQQELSRQFKDFVEKNKEISSLSRKDGKGKLETKQISSMIHKLPQYQDTLSKFSLHINLMQELMRMFKQQGLDKLALWEQNMAMGADPDGKDLKNVLQSLMTILSDSGVGSENKLRLLLTYIVTQGGLSDDKKNKIMQMADLDRSERKTIENLSLLGVSSSKNKGVLSSIFKKLSGNKKQGDVAFHLSRYTPKVKEIAVELLKNTLNTNDFPYVMPPPSSFRLLEGNGSNTSNRRGSTASATGTRTANTGSLRSKGGPQSLRSRGAVPAWVTKRDDADDRSTTSPVSVSSPDADRIKSDKKLFIFVIGGVTHSETRTAYELGSEHGLEVNVGGTSIITPTQFLQKLGNVERTSSYSLDF